MFKTQALLIVEDNAEEALPLMNFAEALGFKTKPCSSYEEFKLWLPRSKSLDFALIDIHLTADRDLKGLKVIRELSIAYPDAVIIGISKDPTHTLGREVTLAGGDFFVKRPFNRKEEFEHILTTGKRIKDFKFGRILPTPRVEPLKQFQCPILNEVQKKYPYKIVVPEDRVNHIKKHIKKDLFCPFLIKGETGTGKEQIAQLIYKFRQELEPSTTLQVIHCATLNSDVGDSALFGHVKGAFTGADTNRKGAIALANGGILFLDEVHTLSLSFQEKLLRFLQDGEFRPLGSDDVQISKAQIICASNANFSELIAQGKFKQDLYFRIGTGEVINLEPIRGNKAYISDLIALFFVQNGTDIPESIFQKLVEDCALHDWNGNIRTLFTSLRSYLRNVESNNFSDVVFENVEDRLLMKNNRDNPLGEWVSKTEATVKLMNSFKEEAIMLLHNKGFNSTEIADRMGLSRVTVYRVIKKLKSL